LFIESEPAGASVYLDGRLAGETPLTIETLAAGVHRVRLVRLRYLENSRLVTVKAGSRATLRTADLAAPAECTGAGGPEDRRPRR
jgi:PEGA domain-containing protein